MKMQTNKVVYAWYYSNQVFYIGIGDKKRSKSKCGRNQDCLLLRNKAERENCFRVEILLSDLSKLQAREIERQLILYYGRLNNGTGCLTNRTIGGEGIDRKFSNARKGKGNPFYGRSHTTETKIKMSKSMSGKNHSRSKPVQTPIGKFGSMCQASKATGIPETTLKRRVISDRHPGFFFT